MIYIQTEGGGNRGYGHITRCVALYQSLKELGFSAWLLIDKDPGAKITHLLKGINHSYFDIKKNLEYIREDSYYIIDTYSKVKGVKKHKNVFMLTDDFTFNHPLVRREFWKRPRRTGTINKKLNVTKAQGVKPRKLARLMAKYKGLIVSGGQSFLEAFAIRDKDFSIMYKNANEMRQVHEVKMRPGYKSSIKCAKTILKALFKYDVCTPEKEDYIPMLAMRNMKHVRMACYDTKRMKRKEFLQYIEKNKKNIRVAKHNNKAIGFVRVGGSGVMSIVINPQYRGIGASDALMKWAKRKKHLTAFIKDDNKQSKKFFEKHGFIDMGAYWQWSK
jgi:spore coat polysaccharide biosynthesis predicted glycosyltransferase SpsG